MKRIVVLTVVSLLLVPLLIAAALLQELPPAVESAIVLLVTLLLGLFGPGWIDVLKNVLGLSGMGAFRLVLLISGAVSLLAMAIGGYFFGFEATPENILAGFGVFLAAVTYVYKALNQRPQT